MTIQKWWMRDVGTTNTIIENYTLTTLGKKSGYMIRVILKCQILIGERRENNFNEDLLTEDVKIGLTRFLTSMGKTRSS